MKKKACIFIVISVGCFLPLVPSENNYLPMVRLCETENDKVLNFWKEFAGCSGKANQKASERRLIAEYSNDVIQYPLRPYCNEVRQSLLCRCLNGSSRGDASKKIIVFVPKNHSKNSIPSGLIDHIKRLDMEHTMSRFDCEKYCCVLLLFVPQMAPLLFVYLMLTCVEFPPPG